MKRLIISMCIATFSLSGFAGTCMLADDLPSEFNTCDNNKLKKYADKNPDFGLKGKREFIGKNKSKLTLFLRDYDDYGKPKGIITEESITETELNGNMVTYYGNDDCLTTYSFSENEKYYIETLESVSSNCPKIVKELSKLHIGKPYTYRKIAY